METARTYDFDRYERERLEELAIRDARVDVNTFAELMMDDGAGEQIRQAPFHEGMHRLMDTRRRGVIRLPRDHGKTTQLIARLAWRIGHNPNVRIKLGANSDRMAMARGRAVKELLESPLYRELFPHVVPGKEWSDQRFSVSRGLVGSPDATMECYGLRSSVVGGRADEVYLDDPDEERVVTSAAERKRNWERVSNVWLNMLEPDARAYIICTPWHKSDVSHQLVNNGWPLLELPTDIAAPAWPERWGSEELADRLRDIGSLAFARGYLLKVLSSEDQPIKGEWFQYWYSPAPVFKALLVSIDPAISEKDSADYTAIGGLGLTFSNNVCLLNIIRKRMDFPTTMSMAEAVATALMQEYGLRPVIGVEANAYQAALPQQLKKTTRFPIYSVKVSKSKFTRASKFAIHVENGRVFLKGRGSAVHPDQRVVYDECTEYPSVEHDDCLDMMTQGTELALMLADRPEPVAHGRRKYDREK